jgi:hypothetical protein
MFNFQFSINDQYPNVQEAFKADIEHSNIDNYFNIDN